MAKHGKHCFCARKCNGRKSGSVRFFAPNPPFFPHSFTRTLRKIGVFLSSVYLSSLIFRGVCTPRSSKKLDTGPKTGKKKEEHRACFSSSFYRQQEGLLCVRFEKRKRKGERKGTGKRKRSSFTSPLAASLDVRAKPPPRLVFFRDFPGQPHNRGKCWRKRGGGGEPRVRAATGAPLPRRGREEVPRGQENVYRYPRNSREEPNAHRETETRKRDTRYQFFPGARATGTRDE